LLRKSDLEWTVVDPTMLSNGSNNLSTRRLAPNEKIGLRHKITRAALAAWMLHEAVESRHVRDEVILSG
jgi:hypothetical protein